MTPLEAEIRSIIATEGPIPVERWMALCLAHPRHGYYVTRDPLGRDFTTAPEISQMFGELVGLWAAATWQLMGAPSPLVLAECGPGRGTLMADALRATARVPGFHDALRLHLVETSPVLREAQASRLATFAPTWHDDLASLPDGPIVLLANEFLDALPIRQLVGTARGWHERLVGIIDDRLAFGIAPDPWPARSLPEPVPGAVLELAPAAGDVVRAIAGRIVTHGGAALVIDYGHTGGLGDTLQAVRDGRPVDPLASPGEVDLTAHVDFAALSSVARAAGTAVHGPTGQGAFLRRLGLEARAARLAAANPARAGEFAAAVARLADPSPGMGDLFKVIAIAHPGLGPLPGFAD